VEGLRLLGDALSTGAAGVSSETGLSVIGFALAFLFFWSGSAKLKSPRRAAVALSDFGLTHAVHPRLGALAGVGELLVATGTVVGVLVPSVSAPAFGVLLLVLVALCVLQLHALTAGQRFACFCFGDDTTPLSWMTLTRALGLAAAAAFLLVADQRESGPSSEAIAKQLALATTIVSVCALASTWPRLMRWRVDPFGLRDELWIDRGTK
jgi:hypothetical protein